MRSKDHTIIDIDRILDDLEAEAIDCFEKRQAPVLEFFEGFLGHTAHWGSVRQKLLKFFGNSGLRGDLLKLIENAKRNGAGHGKHEE